MKATAQAHPNIALTKYWGKRDQKLVLPFASSVSMTLDQFFTKTTVEFDSKYKKDEFFFHNQKITTGEKPERAQKHLELVRKTAGIKTFARIQSENNFPTAAGLASSASGFASLTMAASKAAGLKLDKKELSILARQGSGSAARSIEGGFVEWQKGTEKNGSDSYAKQFAPAEHWPEFRMIVNIVQFSEKKWSSTKGMDQSAATSPYFREWVNSADQDANKMKKLVLKRDLEGVGELAEWNALKMHAVMIATKPALLYWQPSTLEILHRVAEWRETGLNGYCTMDAGPQVKVICLEKDEKELVKRLHSIKGIRQMAVCKAGPDATMLQRDLF